MAFTTQVGTDGSDTTSYIGTDGSDVLNITTENAASYVGGRKAADSISVSINTNLITIKGGEGNDVLDTRATSTTLTNSFINLNKNDDTLDLGTMVSSTVKGGSGNDNVFIAELQGGTYNGNKGNDTTNVNNATDTFIYSGQGDDVSTLSGTISGTTHQGDIGNDIINLNAAARFSRAVINGNADQDTININAIAAFDDSSRINGGAGDDNITGTSSTVAFTASGDDGDDSVTGGSGGDTLNGNSGADNIASSDGNDSSTGGIGNDTIGGGNGTDTITAGLGVDQITGGAGDDLFIYDGTTDVGTGETINGNANNDTILVQSANTDFTNLGTATILTAGNVERVRITDTLQATFTGVQFTGQAINVNGSSTGISRLNIDVTTNVAVDVSTLAFTATGGTAFATGTDIIDIDVADGLVGKVDTTGTTLADSIDGGDGTDSLTGNTGTDTMNGGNGADTIVGNVGGDSLTGGGGNDDFKWSIGDGAALNLATATGFDQTADFVSGADEADVDASTIKLNNAAAPGANVANVASGAFDYNGAVGFARITGLTAADLTNTANVVAAIGNVANKTATESAYFAVDQTAGGLTGIYGTTLAGAAGAGVLQTEIRLIATVQTAALADLGTF